MPPPPTPQAITEITMPDVDNSNSSGAALDKVALFRAAVQGVRRCLELSQETPKNRDTLCDAYLKFVEGADPKGQLERFCEGARPYANGDLYLTAILKALDRARSEADAELWVMSSVNEQLMRRADARRL